jgi:16S rRNA (guanine966-N2)-methyltransferase
LAQSINVLAQSAFVNENTLLYVEAPKILTQDDIPSGWQILKQKTAGEVVYHLVQAGTP